MTIKDQTGAEVLSRQVPRTGRISAPLVQYVQSREGKTALTPHTVIVRKDGETVTRKVTVDRKRSKEEIQR